MADSLRMLLRPSDVIAPDVPIEPDEALRLLHNICESERPELVVGLSLGGFLAQQLRGQRKIVVNPDFHVSRLMRTKIGTMEYLSPRLDGALSFEITPEICDRYEALEAVQFQGIDAQERALTAGMFAIQDELVHCGPEFELHYPSRAIYYPGGHLPAYPELKAWLPSALMLFQSAAESEAAT